MIYLLRDDLVGDERLAELRARLGPADVQSLNLSVLDSARLALGDLRAVTEAMPFLSDRRLVVVRRFFSASRSSASSGADAPVTRRGRSDADREVELLDYLPNVPPFTDLVFVEDADFKAAHAAVRAVRKLGGEVLIEELPRGDALGRWIADRVRTKAGRIEPAAINELVMAPIDDLRELDAALELLVTYAGERAITVADTRELIHATRAGSVFELVDAVGTRDRRAALRAYRELLRASQSPIYLLTMLARQFRLLLIAREALDRREDLVGALKTAPFVAQKIGQQARLYPTERLIAAVDRLVQTDQAIKTGQLDQEIALELLVVELTER